MGTRGGYGGVRGGGGQKGRFGGPHTRHASPYTARSCPPLPRRYRGEGYKGVGVGTRGGLRGGTGGGGQKGRFGGPHTRRCTHKAVHTQGGLWPPQESCYLRGGAGAGPRVERSELSVERSEPKGTGGDGAGGTGRGVRGGCGGGGGGATSCRLSLPVGPKSCSHISARHLNRRFTHCSP